MLGRHYGRDRFVMLRDEVRRVRPTGASSSTFEVTSFSTTVTAEGAQVEWYLNEAGSGQVEYGTTTSYGSTTTLDATLATYHLHYITGLTAGTTYHYRVRSQNAEGDWAYSPDATFVPTAVEGYQAGYIL